jgi:hypothetical protein
MASVEKLQSEITVRGGFILSDGTCNLRHLLPKAYDLLNAIETKQELRTAILSCFDFGEYTFDTENASLFMAQYHDYCELKSDSEKLIQACELWNEDVFHYFNSIAPDGYYFGSNEGDGACFGWFKLEDEEEYNDEETED